ncbi:hypothetical protein Naga_102012g1, partial [Nannochloropsis gaditana]
MTRGRGGRALQGSLPPTLPPSLPPFIDTSPLPFLLSSFVGTRASCYDSFRVMSLQSFLLFLHSFPSPCFYHFAYLSRSIRLPFIHARSATNNTGVFLSSFVLLSSVHILYAFFLPSSSLLPLPFPPCILPLSATTAGTHLAKQNKGIQAATKALWRDIARLSKDPSTLPPPSSLSSPTPLVLNEALYPPTRLARLLSLQRQHDHAAVDAE